VGLKSCSIPKTRTTPSFTRSLTLVRVLPPSLHSAQRDYMAAYLEFCAGPASDAVTSLDFPASRALTKRSATG